MRFLDPGTGEITDRLTILTLKLLHGQAAGKPTEHFQRESTALLAKIRARTLNGSWFEGVLGLAAINASLWQLEDAMRDLRRKYTEVDGLLPVIAETGMRIQEFNDRRNKLIEQINRDTGELQGEEKV